MCVYVCVCVALKEAVELFSSKREADSEKKQMVSNKAYCRIKARYYNTSFVYAF